MGIQNRDLDVSEQQHVFEENLGATGQSVLRTICDVPYPASLQSVKIVAQGLSSVSTLNLQVQRFITGTGVTAIAGGATALTVLAMSTSGPMSMVLAAAGSSFLQLQAGDCIQVISSGAGAVTDLAVAVVLKALQDAKSFF